jgi:cyanophycinase-like exopeptidase
MIAGGMSEDKTLRLGAIELARGLGFLPPNVTTDSHFSARSRENRSRAALASLPRVTTSIAIDEDTAVYITGQRCQVFGVGSVSFFKRPSRKPTRRLTDEEKWFAVARSVTVTTCKAGDTFEL